MPLSEVLLVSMGLLTIAMVAAGLFRHFSIPYTVLLVVIGLGLSELTKTWHWLTPLQEFRLTPDLVFFVFLPALIFESGLSLDARQLIKDLAPVLTLAIPALLISTFLVGAGVWFLVDIHFVVALLFGALISATDPVAVVTIFKELGAPLRLNVLVEGESLFNDATAIVVFGILLAMIVGGTNFSLVNSGTALLEFVRVFMGGVLVGAILGLFVSELLFRLQCQASAVITMSLVAAYGSFIIGEHVLHVSGVMATVSAAVILNVYGLTRIPGNIKPILSETWEFVGLVANSFLFLLVGLSIDASSLITHSGLILAVVCIVLLARAATIYTLVPVTTRLFKLPKVSMGERHIMWWGGLKGGLAIAIVLSIPESLPSRDLLINLTLGVVLFTLMVNAWSIRPLMKKLKLDQLTDDEQAELEEGYAHARQSSHDMLTEYQDLGLVTKDLALQLKQDIDETLSSNPCHFKPSSAQRKIYLASLRVEMDTVNQLYTAGIISQYTLTDIRHTLQLDRDLYDASTNDAEGSSGVVKLNIFQAFEMWLLKYLREKNWAAKWFGHYQMTRLNQRIQRSVAGVVMCQAVLDFLQSQDDLKSNEMPQAIQRVQQRLQRRQENLVTLSKEFPLFYDALIQDIFSCAAFKTAQLKVGDDYHRGNIGIKAFSIVVKKIEAVLNNKTSAASSVSLYGDVSVIERISALSLFKSLSKKGALELSLHAQRVAFLKRDIIIGQGEKGDALYLLERGTVQVSIKTENGDVKNLEELGPGDVFGETALLGDHVRTATITAQSAVTLLRLTRKDVLKAAGQCEDVKKCLEELRDAHWPVS